ncbi:ISAs1 family transposase [Nonomuraea sp. NPDC049480]|uniref:ISAs1 family transposase n=1 Tax=Nonomuraea sp. NPDC049480 TaxID=3364353 RepID=UPI0037AC3DB2
MPSSPIDVLARHLEHVTVADPLTDPLDLPTLAEVLDAVPDPRSRRGRRYRLGPLLALSLLAVLGGATSLLKITRFIAGYDPDLLARAGLPGTPRLAASTLGRLLARLDGDAFDTATRTYLASLAAYAPPAATSSRPSVRTELAGVAVDGKTLRGSRTPDGTVHLLAATRHDPQIVVAQRQIEAKSNEIPAFTPLLSGLDLSSVVITADALHTQHAHARQIVEARGHYLFIVKGNQCATRRSDASPPKAGQTRREVCWVRWLTWSRKAKGTEACQETGGRVQVPGKARRGTRAVWRRLDCLNPNLQRQQFTATGMAPETGARRDRDVLVRPGQPSRRERCPARALKEMSGAPGAALNVCQRRTWDHRPGPHRVGGDGVLVVVAGVTPGQGERESRSQGEGAQVERTPIDSRRYA